MPHDPPAPFLTWVRVTEGGEWGWFLSERVTKENVVALWLLQTYGGVRQRKAVEAVEWLRTGK